MQLLKVSTVAKVHIGVFVDAADGFTPETGLAAGTVDSLVIYKHDAATATDISATTAFAHVANGQYTVTLSGTDTNTVGRLTLYIVDTSVCQPIEKEFTVLPAKVYDSMIAGSDNLETNAIQFLGQAVTLSGGNLPDVNVKEISDDEPAADALETFCDGGANIPADIVKISGSATGANNLELYTTGADRMPVDVEEIGAAIDLSSVMKTSAETAVANKLNAAIPGGATTNSINQRVQAMDDLTQASGSGDLAAMKTAITSGGVKIDLTQALDETPTSVTLGAAFYYPMASVFHRVTRVGVVLSTYQSNASTVSWTVI